MRKVVVSRNVAHLWAHQTQSEARNAGRTFWFNGRVLGSYGTAIGYHFGEFVVLSRYNFSMTTAGQLSCARSAAAHLRVIYSNIFSRGVSWVADRHREGLEQRIIADLLSEYERLLAGVKLKRSAYTRNAAAHAVASAVSDYNYVLTAFKSRRKKLVCPAEVTRMIDETQAQIERINEDRDRLAAERATAERLANADKVAAWLNGEAVNLPWSCQRAADGSDLLTVRGDEIVTGQDARAPLSHVVRALAFYNTLRQAGGLYRPWATNGHKIPVGVFQIDSIDAAGNVRAGCHKFTAAEIARFTARWHEVLK